MFSSCPQCEKPAMIPSDKDYGEKKLCIECTPLKIQEIKKQIIESSSPEDKRKLLQKLEIHQELLQKMKNFYDSGSFLLPSEL